MRRLAYLQERGAVASPTLDRVAAEAERAVDSIESAVSDLNKAINASSDEDYPVLSQVVRSYSKTLSELKDRLSDIQSAAAR